jgi:hypothetical protein
VRHRSIGAWGRKWQCSPRRRGLLWRFGAKSMVTAVLRPPELGKRTLRRGGAARGSFLWPEVVVRGGIEGGGGLAASLHRNRGEKGGRRGAGPAWACHVEKKRRRQRGVWCTWCSCWVSRQNVATAATTTVGWCNWAGERALGAGGFGWMKTVRGPAVWTRLDEQ